ncbi:MAG: adenylosuccinate lyase, partial [Gammaproteobacteria bacterium]
THPQDNHAALTAVSAVDGRYHTQTAPLSELCSEFGLIHFRVTVEVNWFLFLSEQADITEVPTLSEPQRAHICGIADHFTLEDAIRIKNIERTTNHDLKAVEYFLKERFNEQTALQPYVEFIHFACTSEDINNLAYGLILKTARDKILLPKMKNMVKVLSTLAHRHTSTPMMARTHGQPASPSTVGKELANVCYRLQRQIQQFEAVEILGKLNGAVGNFNAHIAAYPTVDWSNLGARFVTSLGLTHNPFTTQIEPHDYVAEYLHTLMRFNTILLDMNRDMWGYIAFEYFVQKPKEGEVGSSTMPHKVNPIDFENSEGNLGVANALMDHLAQKLPISRFQRDLTDSTVLRTLGTCLGHTLIGLVSAEKGLSKVSINTPKLLSELNANWALLAEPIQTVMRRYGLKNPYEQLKTLTRGQTITEASIKQFIHTLESTKLTHIARYSFQQIGLLPTPPKRITLEWKSHRV